MSPSTAPARARERVATSLHAAVTGPRLLLAVKTAVAVGLAWTVARYLPGVTDDHPYYAPLGALISMHPTLMDSMKSSLQTLAALATGMLLALLVVFTVGPNVWTLALVAGIGVLLSGTGWFGIGREYIAVAAVFVLIIGGHDAEAYSLSYLVPMAVGLVIGLVINLLVAPRTFSATASARVEGYRRELASHLDGIGEALETAWPPERTGWTEGADALETTARDVRAALAEADRSRRGNPRAIGGRHGTGAAHARLETLESIAVRVRDISDALEDVVRDRPGGFPIDESLIPAIARACRAVAAAIADLGQDDKEAHRTRAAAAQAVRRLVDELEAGHASARSILGPGVLVATHLRRIVVLLHVRAGEEGR
ncbi:aromatic acid exporter family protein [Microbacterium sp. CIAB417]|uniref:FUSC family protein n=1 Tax=Microbacterium sp. CIAB417 TaxID=2860287 RepID=UPI001FADD522|nr:aromatic acid exporter family protein [Microbacterium sp. CIAB417]